MRALKKKWIAVVCGWAFVTLGFVGLLVPVLPGVLFFSLGLLILSTQYLWASRMLAKLTARFPSLGRRLLQVRAKARLETSHSSPDP